MTLPVIDFASWGTDEVREALANEGYLSEDHEFKFAKYEDAFKYIGYSSSSHVHRFLIGFEDDENSTPEETKYFVTRILVWVGNRGKLVADYQGCPEKDNLTMEEALEYIEKVCN